MRPKWFSNTSLFLISNRNISNYSPRKFKRYPNTADRATNALNDIINSNDARAMNRQSRPHLFVDKGKACCRECTQNASLPWCDIPHQSVHRVICPALIRPWEATVCAIECTLILTNLFLILCHRNTGACIEIRRLSTKPTLPVERERRAQLTRDREPKSYAAPSKRIRASVHTFTDASVRTLRARRAHSTSTSSPLPFSLHVSPWR